MDWLEAELKKALSRKEPSEDFDLRLAAATRRGSKVVILSRRWIAAAAVVVIMAAAGEGYRWHRGQVAKEEVMLAIRIAGGKLSRVQMEIARGR